MMQKFAIYDSTGRITQYGQVQAIDVQHLEGSVVLLDETPVASMQYIAAGVLTPRPSCPVTKAVSGLTVTLSGVPVGAVVTVTGGADETVTQSDPSGELALAFSHPGVYHIRCDAFPAQEFTTTETLA